MHNNNTIDPWRKEKGVEIVERDGKTWYWCKDHKGSDYDGLYVTHKQEDHDATVAKYKQRDAAHAFKKKQPKDEQPAEDRKLKLTDKMKSALYTHGGFATDEDAESFFSQFQLKE